MLRDQMKTEVHRIFFSRIFAPVIVLGLLCFNHSMVVCDQEDDFYYKLILATIVKLESDNADLRRTGQDEIAEEVLSIPIDQWIINEDVTRPIQANAKTLNPRLINLIYHSDEDIQRTAIELIARIGISGEPAFEDLLKILQDKNYSFDTRLSAFQAVSMATPEHKSILDSVDLTSVLKLSEIEESLTAVESDTHHMGVLAGVSQLSVVISEALRISGHTKVEVPFLVKKMQSEKGRATRFFYVSVLGNLSTESSFAIPHLRQQLKNESDFEIQMRVASSILTITNDSKLIHVLADDLGLEQAHRQQFIEKSSRELQDKARKHKEYVDIVSSSIEDFLPIIRAELRNGRGPAQRDALRLLEDIGPLGAAALPEVNDLIEHNDTETKTLAKSAIESIKR